MFGDLELARSSRCGYEIEETDLESGSVANNAPVQRDIQCTVCRVDVYS